MASKRTNAGKVASQRSVCAWSAAILTAALIGAETISAQSGFHQPPDLAGFLLVGEEDADGDGDGTKETHVARYRNSAGDSVFSMTTKGHLWAWSLESGPAGGTDPSRNYVIRDSDCDGSFDELYGLNEQFRVPACLK